MPATPATTPADATLLAAYLADRDEHCPSCRYNLRGLTIPACPECNAPLRLRVALTEPRLAWFLTAIIGLSCGIGLNGLLFGALIAGKGSIGRDALLALGLCLGSFLILAACLATLLAFRRRYARRTRTTRAALALGACTLTLASVAALVILVRIY